MKNIFSALRFYLERHVTLLLAFLIASVIFAVVFYLYDLPAEAVLYAALLSFIALVLLGTIRFWSFYKKHKLLSGLKNAIEVCESSLPEGGGLIESDYKELVVLLSRSTAELACNADMRYRDMCDYYTMWAHQIKTPIAAMRLLLQTEQNEMNDELSDQLFKVEQYVEMVLQYLRSESISSDFLIREYPLEPIVKAAVMKFRRQFIRKKISLIMGEVACNVTTDEKWLCFVIEQVLSNALKYTKEEGSVAVYMDGELPCTLVVEDTGIGICEEDLPRIFEKGFTGYNGRNDKKSTGIGLYLAKRILTKLSHGITVESELDRGTKIKINLAREKLRFE